MLKEIEKVKLTFFKNQILEGIDNYNYKQNTLQVEKYCVGI